MAILLRTELPIMCSDHKMCSGSALQGESSVIFRQMVDISGVFILHKNIEYNIQKVSLSCTIAYLACGTGCFRLSSINVCMYIPLFNELYIYFYIYSSVLFVIFNG